MEKAHTHVEDRTCLVKKAGLPLLLNCGILPSPGDMTLPSKVQESMQMQVEAERKKRASVLESEGLSWVTFGG